MQRWEVRAQGAVGESEAESQISPKTELRPYNGQVGKGRTYVGLTGTYERITYLGSATGVRILLDEAKSDKAWVSSSLWHRGLGCDFCSPIREGYFDHLRGMWVSSSATATTLLSPAIQE